MDDLTKIKLIAQLKRDEGWRATMYADSVGVATLGYGHNLSVPISELAGEVILRADVDAVEKALAGALPWAASLSSARYGVLLAMGFNLGVGGLLKFEKFLAHVRAFEWEDAAREMMDSTWARQVGMRGHRLAEQMRNDVWAA